ncbi:hypothetical protein SOVF_056110 isoform B [Spinacia oleracea]|uniref:Zinc finger CCCH domain-containing protein 18 isoform X3 n=1 Tax=Spinacia oleracea TaxID=3562 RepID=A0A9R0JPS4_SPIOL|nr:zinc finger CCCH domain-containing protein 18-like isoform X3 [Spinacia oleracea]KNA20033.1 hypothetical protein SOVF_056110 isoform B [Spinacia oleracea]
MDLSEATKILLDRIQKLEPEIATKIIGCILIQDHGEREMIRLAYAPEQFIENLVQKTKLQLGYLSKSPVSSSLSSPVSINPSPVSDVSMNYMPFSPNGSRPYSSPTAFPVRHAPYWDLQSLTPEQQSILSSDFQSYGDSIAEDFCLQNQGQFMGFDEQMDSTNFPGDVYYGDAALSNLRSRRSPNLSDLPTKMCHYFSKGFCKHGSSCRYSHGPDSFQTLYSPNELGLDDHIFSPGSLEKLELEISELLKSRRGNPVSIASLPMLFYEKYGRTLQADGYLTESQRHGRAGYSLTKLLARLKRIRLIDRAHGQHAVILTEDASKYNLDNRTERNDPGPIVSGSRQIYLTFPAESTFTEEDVSNYFGTFGAVEDVRIPCQQKRMFGFVTFASANTVKTVLAKGNPHFVCGSRVLVKPYREKSKLVDRKFMEKNDHGMYYPGNYLELEPDFHPMPRCEAPRFLRRQLMEEQEHAIERERRRISELQLGRKNMINRQFMGYGMEELSAFEDHSKISSAEEYHYLLDVFNNCSLTDDRLNNLSPDYTDQESSQGIDLPESPFASTMGNGISTVI